MGNLTFNEFYDRAYQNVCNLVLLKFDIQNFYNASEEIQERVFLKFSLITRIQNMTFRTLVLTIYHSLKRNERYSLSSTLKTFKAEKFSLSLEDRQQINVLLRRLADLESSADFKDIEAKRNQHYAHLAHPQAFRMTKITYGQTVTLANEIENIFREMHLLIKGSDIFFDMLKDDTGNHLYRALLSYQNLQELILDELKKPDLNLKKIEELRRL